MRNYWKPGAWNAYCDVCKFRFKSTELRKRWDSLMVCAEDFEYRNPQDFLRLRKEDLHIPWSRSSDAGSFIIPQTLYVDDGYVQDIDGGVYVA